MLEKNIDNIWRDFKKHVSKKNRYFPKHAALDMIKDLAFKNIKIIRKNTILYRSRILNDLDSDLLFIHEIENLEKEYHHTDPFIIHLRKLKKICETTGFWGYDKANSFVNLSNNNSQGRSNPIKIPCLYASDDDYTSLVEVRPNLLDNVSVAKIKTKEDLTLVDFSTYFIQQLQEEDNMQELLIRIAYEFGSITNDYLISQIISSFIKSLEFDFGHVDGIMYDSSLNMHGINYAIFNYDKCEAINSEIFKLNKIQYSAIQISPQNSDFIRHKKIQHYLELIHEKAMERYSLNVPDNDA